MSSAVYYGYRPLAIAVKTNQNIAGLSIGQQEHRLAVFFGWCKNIPLE